MKITIFASGSGSNAENIIRYFQHRPDVFFPFILCNNKDAFVLERAKNVNIPTILFSKADLYEGKILDLLQKNGIEWIILAGFLLRIPSAIVAAYPNRIINIHPALLPKFGGKGMYGHHVHEAVIAAGERESGITIHYVNDRYDDGAIIFQAACPVLPSDTPDDVAKKVHELEYRYFPQLIEKVIAG